MSRLSLFILVGTCMLLASAITSSRGKFLPQTRKGKFLVVFLVIFVLCAVGFALWVISHVL